MSISHRSFRLHHLRHAHRAGAPTPDPFTDGQPSSDGSQPWPACANSFKLRQTLVISRKAQHGSKGLGLTTLVFKDPELGDGSLWVYKAGPVGSRISQCEVVSKLVNGLGVSSELHRSRSYTSRERDGVQWWRTVHCELCEYGQ
jgi:hypothetical protein